jgi:DNA polymerase III subunit beta
MKFTIEKKDLWSNIQHLYSIVPSKNTMPILTNYLIEADDRAGTLRFTATDLDITVLVDLVANVSESGKAAVSAKLFTEMVGCLPDAMIVFEKIDDQMKVRCKDIDFKLQCADADQFPLVPTVDMAAAREIPAKTFAKMVENTSFAVSNETNRPVFTGIFWRMTPDNQLMVATDGKKISEFKVTQPMEIPEPVEKIIPPVGCLFLRKTIDEQDNKIMVLIEQNRVMFRYKHFTIFTHVLEGHFPDYTKAIPTDNANVLVLKREILQETIKRISILSSEESNRIKLDISPKTFVINSQNRDQGEAREVITDFKFTGEAVSIALNYKFLDTILKVIETEMVEVHFGSAQSPVLIFNHELKAAYSARFLLMPLRNA